MSHHPIRIDEYPLHQAPLSLARVDSSDRNFYDRCYFNAHDRTGEIFFVAGMGFYPNLDVKDAYVTVRTGDRQVSLRLSDALGERSLDQHVGPFQITVIDPLQRLRLVCETDDIAFDLTWVGSYPAMLEQPHLMLSAARPTLDAQRFAQVGTWSGSLRVEDRVYAVTPGTWVGTRDRSWGIRPVGEAEPTGRDQPREGFWWLYAPLRFDDFAILLVLQESADGFRTLNDAVRIDASGTVEQLGWPRVDVSYRSGTRLPTGARIDLTRLNGSPLSLDIEALGHVALHIGCGYGGDSEWAHGQWLGENYLSTHVYDHSDPDIVAKIPWGVLDHVARATCDGQIGYGLFEHASMGRHDPTGFLDWFDMVGAKGRTA